MVGGHLPVRLYGRADAIVYVVLGSVLVFLSQLRLRVSVRSPRLLGSPTSPPRSCNFRIYHLLHSFIHSLTVKQQK